jgi:hypothetical protein
MLQQHLLWAQQRMKSQADKYRSEHEFSVGDLVYLKVQPYVQMSLVPRSCQKLSYRFFRPYKILQRVDAVAYKLELPPQPHIHNVVHVSQLKKHIPPDTSVSIDIAVIHPNASRIPAGCLQNRLIQKGGSTSRQVLVRWHGLSPSLVTWESLEEIRRLHPLTTAWGQAFA